jgi:hypothetical protein
MSRKPIEEEPLPSSPLERFQVETAAAVKSMESNKTPEFVRKTFLAITDLLTACEESAWNRGEARSIIRVLVSDTLHYGDTFLTAAEAIANHPLLEPHQERLAKNTQQLKRQVEIKHILDNNEASNILLGPLALLKKPTALSGPQYSELKVEFDQLVEDLASSDPQPKPNVTEARCSGYSDYPGLFTVSCFNGRVVTIRRTANPLDSKFTPSGVGQELVLARPEKRLFIDEIMLHAGSETKPGEMTISQHKGALPPDEARFEITKPALVTSIAEQIRLVCQLAQKGTGVSCLYPTPPEILLEARGLVIEQTQLPPDFTRYLSR